MEDLYTLISTAKEMKLENVEILDRYSFRQISEIYNGIGPDRFHEWLREMLDDLHPSLCVVALIHDLEYYEGGSKEMFTESNERFYRNGKTVAFAKYAWYDPRRYLVWNKARQFRNICNAFGWVGWNKNGKKQGGEA